MRLAALDAFSNDELFQLLNCHNFSALEACLPQKIKLFCKKSVIPELADLPLYHKPVANSFELIGLGLDIYSGVSSLVTISFAITVLALCSIGLVGVTCLVGFGCHSMLEEKKLKDRWRLLFIQEMAISTLHAKFSYLKKYKYLDDLALKKGGKNLSELIKTTSHRTLMLKSAGYGVAIGLATFSGIFYGLPSLISALGYVTAASAISGPIGLAITATVCFLILGTFFAYRYYQGQKKREQISNLIKIRTHHIAQQAKHYGEIQECITLRRTGL